MLLFVEEPTVFEFVWECYKVDEKDFTQIVDSETFYYRRNRV